MTLVLLPEVCLWLVGRLRQKGEPALSVLPVERLSVYSSLFTVHETRTNLHHFLL
jgi:hypothetical protein